MPLKIKVAIVGFKSAPSNMNLGLRKTGGQNLSIYYMLQLCPKFDVQPDYYDWENGPLATSQSIHTDYSQAFNTDDQSLIDPFAEYLIHQLEQGDYDIIHTCGVFAGDAVRLARESSQLLRRIPWVHTNFATISQRLYTIENKTVAEIIKIPICYREMRVNTSADWIITASLWDSYAITQVFGINIEKVRAIYSGVEHNTFYPRPIKRICGIVSAGRMAPIKDYLFLINSIATLKEICPNLLDTYSCEIVGGNDDERRAIGLPEAIAKAGLANHIRLVDALPQEQLAHHLSSYRVFAGTSRQETFGLLPAEARACGTPTVVRDNSAYSETCKVEGSIVSSNESYQLFAQDLANILRLDENEWGQLSRGAHASSLQLTWDEFVRAHCQAYKEYLSVANI